MNPEVIFAIWLLMLGAAGGSFVCAMAGRLCAGQDWLRAPSTCGSCQTRIGLRDLIPLWSYLALRGRCRQCGGAIPSRLWLAELAGLSAAALILSLEPIGPLAQIASLIFLLSLLGLFLTDAQCFRLPNPLTLALAVSGLCVGSLWHGFVGSAFAMGLGTFAFWALAMAYRRLRGREGLGQGDVKMMAGLSAMAGPAGIPLLTLIAALGGLVVTLAQGPRGVARRQRVPFGCYLAAAGVAVWAAQRLGLV